MTQRRSTNTGALERTARAFFRMLPVVIGMLLLTSLLLSWLPPSELQLLFGRWTSLDVLVGAVTGSIAMGHPLAGYILGGELLAGGVSLAAVTALIVSWVTVGLVQLPAEGMMLGWRFALLRNLLCFVSCLALSCMVAATLWLLG